MPHLKIRVLILQFAGFDLTREELDSFFGGAIFEKFELQYSRVASRLLQYSQPDEIEDAAAAGEPREIVRSLYFLLSGRHRLAVAC